MTGFDRRTVLLLHLGSNQPDPATGTTKRLSDPVAGLGWLYPKRNKPDCPGLDKGKVNCEKGREPKLKRGKQMESKRDHTYTVVYQKSDYSMKKQT